MSSVAREHPTPKSQVVDLLTVTAELQGVSGTMKSNGGVRTSSRDISHLWRNWRRVIGRRGVLGKAVRVGTQTAGYTLRDLWEPRGPLWSCCGSCLEHPRSRESLLHATIDAIRQRGVRRIESPCVSMASPWLVLVCERVGSQTAWRAFLRVELACAHASVPSPALCELEPWRQMHVHEAAAIMQAAYQTTVHVELICSIVRWRAAAAFWITCGAGRPWTPGR